MSIRLIAGRAGSGKTHWCLARIAEELTRSMTDGPKLILLVPEQAALQMERGLLMRCPARALGRCEVLSFRRLAHRILSEARTGKHGPIPTPLSPIGRQMALRRLIQQNRRRLREFSKVAERSGFISALSRGIVELLQESVTVGQLDDAAAGAETHGDPSAPRLHDMALLLRAYLDYLGDSRVDPESVLDLARSRLDTIDWLAGAHIWIDGFAGLTKQQMRMIVALAQRAVHIDLALLLDPDRARARDFSAAPDDFSLFARTERTWYTVAHFLREANATIDEPLLLTDRPRFRNAPMLAQLERDLFNASLRASRNPQSPIPNPQLHLIEAPSRRAEVAAAVRTIVDLVQRPDRPPRYRDIAIIVRDLTPYHDLVSAELAAHNIPFFIDRRRQTFHHPLVQLVRAAISMRAEGPFDQAMAMLLKTGLNGLPDDRADALENYQLAYGLNTASAWEDPWPYPVQPGDRKRATTPAARNALAGIHQSCQTLREQIGDWWPVRPNPSPSQGEGRGEGPNTITSPCGTWVANLYALLERLNVRQTLAQWCSAATTCGDLDEAEEHQQVWADLVKLFDEIIAALGDEPMTGRQFQEIIESGLSEFTVGLVPATLDQVLVSSIERSRHPPIRAAFILGMAEGQFPQRIAEDTIFADDDREKLAQAGIQLGQTRSRQLLDERMLAYVAVTRPSEFLWISYPRTDDAAAALPPSPYWPAIQAALPDVAIERLDDLETDSCAVSPSDVSTVSELAGGLANGLRLYCEDKLSHPIAESWFALYDWSRSDAATRGAVANALSSLRNLPDARLTPASAAALWQKPYRTSVSALEKFAQCPFQHFAARGLRLEQRAVYDLTPMDLGRIYHRVLEHFVLELIDSGRTLGELSTYDIASSLSRLCQDIVPKFAEELRLEEAQARATIRRGRRDLLPAVRGQRSSIARTPLRPKLAERSFGFDEPGALPALELRTTHGPVQVRGVIDRVDLLPAGDKHLAVVFDYKRSLGKRLALGEVYHGLALQLLAYLLVLRDHGGALSESKLVPGGAFYLPLLSGLQKLEHPREADDEGFDAYKPFRPRGVIDFDWIDQLDPSLETGYSKVFSVFRTKERAAGHIDSSDAVGDHSFAKLLDHVRQKMSQLAEDWLNGNIAIRPAQHGDIIACTQCKFASVCRIEYATRQTNRLEVLDRTTVLDRLAMEGGADA